MAEELDRTGAGDGAACRKLKMCSDLNGTYLSSQPARPRSNRVEFSHGMEITENMIKIFRADPRFPWLLT